MGSSSQDLNDVAKIITMRSLDVTLENELSSQSELMGFLKNTEGVINIRLRHISSDFSNFVMQVNLMTLVAESFDRCFYARVFQ